MLILLSIFKRRWWKARRDRQYNRLSVIADESDAPWKAYSDRLGSFEMPRREPGKS